MPDTFSIYVILCSCETASMGSSTCMIKVKILEHVACIKNNVMEAPLTEHFHSHKYNLEDLYFFSL